MLARRDTRREAARLRRLSLLQTLENQSQIWGIRCHSCTGREGLPPSWKLSYKTYILRFTRELRFSFNQRIAHILMCYQILGVGLPYSYKYHRSPEGPDCGAVSYWPSTKLISSQDQADRKYSATRPWWSKGMGGCDVSMTLCSSSSGCQSRPAQGEPARAGSKPCDGFWSPGRRSVGRQAGGPGDCGPETYHLPGGP